MKLGPDSVIGVLSRVDVIDDVLLSLQVGFYALGAL
jgi:hypothetical protein